MTSLLVQATVLSILGLGLALLFGGLVGAAQWLRVERRGVAPGAVSLAGRCRAIEEDTVTAPVSDETALCHEWHLEREAGRVTRPVWRTVTRGGERVPFEVRSDDQWVQVDPESADMDLADDTVEVLSESADIPPSVAARLESLPELDGDERYRLVERRLEPSDQVAVTGRLLGDGPDRPTVAGPTLPGLVGRLFGVPFTIADVDRDGGRGRLRDRAIAGFVLGLPPTFLSLVLLFPPELAS